MTWASSLELRPEEELGFREAIDSIEASLRYGIDPSLEPVRKLLAEMGHPEYSFDSVQVAGTNGKTSTSRYTAALLGAHGYKVGLFTSPHLVDYTERVEIGGEPIGEEAFAQGISLALAAWKRICDRDENMAKQGVTEFELITAGAMAMYALADVDYVVLEVGLGGRWDATSAVPTVACAITGIGMDHMHILGDTLGAIAGEKAQVIHPGIPVILGTNAVRPQEVLDVMLNRCERTDVRPCAVVDVTHDDVPGELADEEMDFASFRVTCEPVGLAGSMKLDVDVVVDMQDEGYVEAEYTDVEVFGPSYQAQNVACALALAMGTLGMPLKPENVKKAIAACSVPGRFQVLRAEPLAMVDACHNPQSAEAFRDAVISSMPDKAGRPTLILGALADKDHRGIVEIVAPLFDRIVVTQSESNRAFGAADLAAEVEAVTGSKPLAVVAGAQEALDALCGESFIACGTITLIGEIAALLG